MGEGDRDEDPHKRKTNLNVSLREFEKSSRGLFKVCGHPDCFQMMAPHAGKEFVLDQYGLRMHMPAVRAELCIRPELASKLHHMLCTLRAVKAGPDICKLRASAYALPRLEPWNSILSKANPILPSLVKGRLDRQHEAISIRGERGDGRELRPHNFMLSCPSCKQQKTVRTLGCTALLREVSGVVGANATPRAPSGFVHMTSPGTSAICIGRAVFDAVGPTPTSQGLSKGLVPLKLSSVTCKRPTSWEGWGGKRLSRRLASRFAMPSQLLIQLAPLHFLT